MIEEVLEVEKVEVQSDLFKSKKESEVVLCQLMLPNNSNFSGKIHGGFILSLMDQVAYACASKHSGNYCVTASINTVDFLNPIEVGDLVTLKASINYVGKSSMVVGIRIESENLQTGIVKHCNSSYFTMVALNEEGEKMIIPGLILENKDDIRRFLESIKRLELKAKKLTFLNETNFKRNNYENQLKEYNVKIV
jgi:uncharacterized protein (TIGR00369 family)